ncbi:MAG: leucine--tRNA ligase [Alphaproteobacteria bacterium]|nr:leucine--tRNA ligase [Alphaproteobacteria bacterium]
MSEHAFDPAAYEGRWQAYWETHKTFRSVADPGKPKFYALGMFPYPSGSGLHVGHPESYTALDIVARYKRMNGFAVLHPMGWDAFGLPAERYAVKTGVHPAKTTAENIARFKHQLKRLGFSYDWDREISTADVTYYRWTQWIFLKLYEQGLAYLADVPVNWCPAQGTVLANEEVEDGKYRETGDPVERRMMRQWMLKITAYADRLLDDLDQVDWPESIKDMQRNWIGRSLGAEVHFGIAGSDARFTVYTTRPDTLFGATYCVLAPEHPLVDAVTTADQRAAVDAYVEVAKNKSDLDRQKGGDKDKTGVFTGGYAINPVNGAKVPIWVADYVLISYGTGAIMAVPAHDERDHAFATRFGIPIVQVVSSPEGHDVQAEAWTGGGLSMNSGPYDGLDTETCKQRITAALEADGTGQAKVNYKLRDWLFSRQRYWGEPFPVVHLEDGTVQPLSPDDLPVALPHVDAFRPTDDGRPPLGRAADWVQTTWQGQPALRELNTMPQWAGSCWYYLRYMDPENTSLPVDPEVERYWGPVDLYIGGVEHAVLHLLYARFWHKVLYDVGLVHTVEPFTKLFNQGMILAYAYRDAAGNYHAPDACEQRAGKTVTFQPAWQTEPVTTDWFVKASGEPVHVRIGKMGKSLANSVDPLDIVDRYGADALRTYEMFMGPLEQVKPWQTSGCEGVYRFLGRVWRLFVDGDTGAVKPFGATSREVRKALHAAIKETTEGIEALKFNTPVSKMMELVNACGGELPSRADAETFLLILSPYAPHLAEELWARIGHDHTLADERWPAWDPAALIDDTVTIAVQVMGKVRGTIEVARDADAATVLAAAKAEPNVARHLEGTTIRKEIVVPGRLVNFVVG